MKDLFSKQASCYAAFRPTYPKELYDFILSNVKLKECAWDCGTGNGQVARDLAPYFKNVKATDSSVKQIEKALKGPDIDYSVSAAERTPFKDSVFDLITVGQAIHWFNIDEFYKEVQRVGKQDALLAVWGYSLLKIDKPIDELVLDFYVNIIGPYWDSERKLVDQHYKTIPFLKDEISCPEFSFKFSWTISELQGYLSTWSSVQKYVQVNQMDPVEDLIRKIRPLWKSEKVEIRFPLFMRCGRIRK
ncbi:MAG: class I SAM-dependent methyltransferase [Cyclobacteriaceae bacterium]|nr:class I SAM-dependent methyltransferase [Cyclobacteriaceae bacterium]